MSLHSITNTLSHYQRKSLEIGVATSDLVFALATVLAVLWFFCIL